MYAFLPVVLAILEEREMVELNKSDFQKTYLLS